MLEDIKKFDSSVFLLNNTTLKKGFKEFIKLLRESDKELVNKDYFYVNIWSIACKPCSDEMPFLDLLAETFDKKIGYIMISAHSNEAVSSFLKNKRIEMKNFVFLNKMIDFISGIYNEIEVTNQAFPLHVVLDKNGNCLAYLFGAFHDENSAAPLINFIKNLA